MFTIEEKEPNQDVLAIISLLCKENEKVKYIGEKHECFTSVCLTEDSLIIKQYSNQNVESIRTKFEGFEEREILYALIEGGDGFLILSNPFEIYFLSKDSIEPIQLLLEKQMLMEECMINVEYPNIIVFGKETIENKFALIEVNLETLQTKNVNYKGHIPCMRTNYFQILVDGRMYIFGGRDLMGQPCEKKFWIYDLEKSFWFALDMEYPESNDFSDCTKFAVSTSRVLVADQKEKKMWVLEVNQNKLTEIKSDESVFENQIFCLKDDLISIENFKIKLIKKQLLRHKK